MFNKTTKNLELPIFGHSFEPGETAVDAIFVELPPFARHRADCLTDEAFRSLQYLLIRLIENESTTLETLAKIG